jgi:hypothetical protein
MLDLREMLNGDKMKIKDLYNDGDFKIQHDPKYLYHGSETADLTILKPHYCPLIRKDVIYASPYKGVAIVMGMHDWTDKELDFGYTSDEPFTLTELIPGKIDALYGDNEVPVYIYQVRVKTFKNHSKIQDWEMISYKKVPIIKEEIIYDKISALRAAGIRINYFRDAPLK